VNAADRLPFAAVVLARDLDACRGLMLGLDVPRRRLHPGVLALLDEPLDGPPLRLDDRLALRVELAVAPSPTDRRWAAERRRRA
jgi:hypothetical protein